MYDMPAGAAVTQLIRKQWLRVPEETRNNGPGRSGGGVSSGPVAKRRLPTIKRLLNATPFVFLPL
jgi:hypothetical protein